MHLNALSLFFSCHRWKTLVFLRTWKRGRAVSCTGLENRRGCESSVSSNLTASAKYLKGNQMHSLIPFFFGTILALFEILAISSLFLSELIHFA